MLTIGCAGLQEAMCESSGMQKYIILLFGPAAHVVDHDRAEVETTAPCSVGQLKALTAQQYPQITELLEVGRLAVNQSFVSEETLVGLDDEIALITMVSGG